MPTDDDDDRAAILARRKRWIALALAGAAATATSGCPRPCLSPVDAGDWRDTAAADAGTDADDHD